MRIHLAADHAGFEAKEAVKAHFTEKGHEIIDHGATTYEPMDDYPPMCIACAQAVKDDPGSLGFVFGGSGNGEQIAANRVAGIRAALGWSIETAKLARAHNNAQVLGIGGRMHELPEIIAIAQAFIDEPWSNEERHQRRIDLLSDYDTKHQK
ncbi:MAG: ribose-5-phosphate isomerase [Actinomycetaceae bacterium]|nr:ribose-5-phosphate isomerase [Actinomycetaceae bacterium]